MKYSVSQSEIHDNPHPQQKYEVIVTSDAPGPWDSVQGFAYYAVTNKQCVPLTPFEGARLTPNTGRKFKLASVDGGKTWTGYFYRDAIEDADYFGRGVCHWDLESVGPTFVVHGGIFGPSWLQEEMFVGKTYTSYFKKKEFTNNSIKGVATEMMTPDKQAATEIAKDPGFYFRMTITVREVTP